ncbi:MAG TPA: helix-turn-helix transcriptional regulator [Chitinophagaceae bacterium]|nr:helix-turn-helix transcriptional regulator [Chitinophagaceae bacterium]
MEKTNIYWYSMSDTAIVGLIGNYIQRTRLEQNKTQQEVADAAGINRTTLVQIEKGAGGTLHTFVRILRSLEQLHLLQSFQAQQQISPLKLAKLEQAKRRRATSKKNTRIENPKSDW